MGLISQHCWCFIVCICSTRKPHFYILMTRIAVFLTLLRLYLQPWRSRQLLLWRTARRHHPHRNRWAVRQHARLHDPATAQEAQGMSQTHLPLRWNQECFGNKNFMLCFCLSEHKLWEHPADGPQHCRASPRTRIWPQLHVTFCTVCLWQWTECKR